MKRRKNKPQQDYTYKGNILYCKGIKVRECNSEKDAKIAADRWNYKHQQTLEKQEERV